MKKLSIIWTFIILIVSIEGQFVQIVQAQQVLPGVIAANGGIAAEEGTTLLDGLISYWKFDEPSGTVADDAHAANNGTADVIINQTGKISKCFGFNGSSDEVAFGNDADLKPTTGLSVCCWFKQYLYQGGIMSTYATGNGWSFYTDDTGHPAFVVYNDWATDVITGGTSITTGEPTVWYSVIVTYDEDYAKLYVNGVSDAVARNFNIDLVYGSANVNIGMDMVNGTRASENIDEICIYNRALTADEALEWHTTTNGGTSYPFE